MAFNCLLPVHLIVAHAMGSTFTSNALDNLFRDNVGIQLIWTGTPTGSISIGVSNNHVVSPNGSTVVTAGTFSTLTLNQAVTMSGSAGDALIYLNQLPFAYYNITYTFVSGSGTLDAYVMAKGV